MDLDSNFDDDYNSINATKIKKKKIEPEVKPRKKVLVEGIKKNSSSEETFDYNHEDDDLTDEEENLSNEESFINDHEEFDCDREEDFDYSDDDCSSTNATKKKKIEPKVKLKKKVTFECTNKNSSEETFDYDHEDEDLTDEENLSNESFINDREEEFDYSHDDEQNLSDKDYSDSESDKDVLDENGVNKKNNCLKEDIYGRIRKPDGTIVVNIILFFNNKITFIL